MRIGVPKEVKPQEFRVGITPAGVHVLSAAGHSVWVERGAGLGIDFTNEMYAQAGATLVDTAAEVYDCPLVVKVKEPQAEEIPLLKKGQMLFTYLHLAPAPDLTAALLKAGIVGIAYETVTDDNGGLPLLIPMSEIAGRLAIQAGASALEVTHGGRGVLLGGVPGVSPAEVVVIGGGVVGTQAARMAMGLGADVTILDVSLNRLRVLDDLYGPRLKTRYAHPYAIRELAERADLLIGAVLLPGKKAPKLINVEHIRTMKAGAVLVDVAIDQGGCAETSHPTTHAEPTFLVDGVVHYCVANMPSACARTSTLALTNATLPYISQLAEAGTDALSPKNPGLLNGLNVCSGNVTHPSVANSLGYPYLPPTEAIALMKKGF
ncbi:MAG: alanine dehydrogenase [Pseudomonadota bacterium]|nr:alanine dehydrogenase [Pseudomonadota bacterium]